MNLAKGRIGEDACSVLGGLIVGTLGLAAFTRADSQSTKRRPFFLFADEFQTFTTLAFVNMMSELRKYGVGLVVAHQHLDQISLELSTAVIGNAGSLISFRVGSFDGATLANEFTSKFGAEDLTTLPNRRIYLKIMVDGSPTPPFSAQALELPKSPLPLATKVE